MRIIFTEIVIEKSHMNLFFLQKQKQSDETYFALFF